VADDNDIKITVTAEGAPEAKSQLDELQKSADGVAKTSDEVAGGSSRLKSALALVGTAAAGAAAGFAVMTAGLVGIGSIMSRGSGVADLKESLDTLATSAGTTGTAILDNLKSATDQTIPSVDLMKSATTALLAGLDPTKFDELAVAARQYADATGGDALNELNSFIDGLAKGNDRFLKSRGIILDTNQVLEDYARTLGTTKDALTEEGKAYAIRQAAIEAITSKTEQFGKISVDAGDAVSQLSTALRDTFDRMTEVVSENEDLSIAFTRLAKAITDVQFEKLIVLLTTIGGKVLQLSAYVVEKLVGAWNLFYDVLSGVLGLFVDLETKADKASKAVQNQFSVVQELSRGWAMGTKPLASFNSVLDSMTAGLVKVGPPATKVSGHIKTISKDAEEGKKKISEYDRALFDVYDTIGDLTDFDAFPELTRQVREALGTDADPNRGAGLQEALSSILESVGKNVDAVEHLGRVIPDEFGKAEDSVRKYNEELEKTKESSDFLGGLKGSVLGGIFGKDGPTLNDLGANLGQSLENALAGAFSILKEGGNSDDWKDLVGDLGASLGSTFGPLGEFLGEALFEGVFSLFDSPDSPGTKFRKSLDKYFAETFEGNRLAVIVNGALKGIEDLDFSGGDFGNPTAGFFDGFKSSSVEVQEAALGIARAFSQLGGQDLEFAGNAAAAFVNNVGGSLNNLGLLIQATGVSAEQLGGALIDAGLDGALSFLAVTSALNGIANAMQAGIPDGIGLVEQALENVFLAGSTGGRATVDALKDIAAEAREVGINTLPELRARLESSGRFTAEQIESTFSALSQYGIQSLDQLLNASQETIIAVLASLQSKGVLEDTGAKVEELVEDLKSLPSEIRSRVVVDLQVNASDRDREVLSRASPNTAALVGPRREGQ
jgi:hypothetical protein